MSYPIGDKLVIGVASSALFDLTASHQVYLDEGEEGYRRYQEQHRDTILERGVAFPFIRRFLSLNACFPDQLPVEVVLLSRNSPETGLRVMKSIAHYGLDITRAAFVTGNSPYPYLTAFNAALFLSANETDVRSALAAGCAAGLVLPGATAADDENDPELRVAFDFDGVIADDEAEAIYKRDGIAKFQAHETARADIPHGAGPLAVLFQKLHAMQRLEADIAAARPGYKKLLRVAIVTARSAPSHERMVHTLKSWGVSANETFFLGGMEKARVLNVFQPHIFFDDQLSHLQSPAITTPMVHVPFGVANQAILE